MKTTVHFFFKKVMKDEHFINSSMSVPLTQNIIEKKKLILITDINIVKI